MGNLTELFDAAEAEAAKTRGMNTAALNRLELLAEARKIAVEIAMSRADRCVTADDVQAVLIERGFGHLGNSAGHLFTGRNFEFTGQWKASERVSNHGHKNRVWRLK